MAKFTGVNCILTERLTPCCWLYSTEQKWFWNRGKEFFKITFSQQYDIGRCRQSLTQSAVIFYTVVLGEIFLENNQQSVQEAAVHASRYKYGEQASAHCLKRGRLLKGSLSHFKIYTMKAIPSSYTPFSFHSFSFSYIFPPAIQAPASD